MAHWQTVPKWMDVSQKNSKQQGKVVEVTGVGPKDDYTSNGAMHANRRNGGGDSDTSFYEG